MIDFKTFKEEYEKEVGVTLYDEEGELEDFYREINLVVTPVCGKWHLNPFPLTAVKRPFCGIATVDITVAAHPDNWKDVCEKMNEFAQIHNGTSKTISGYSVSYNCQTCGVVSRILDVNVGVGEVIEINQQLSFIIIESGVSAYDTFIYIDGIQIPYLSLVESKTHTTSNIPSSNGIVETISEIEAYGIDFVVPYMEDDSGIMFRDIIDRSTGNEAHCVVVDVDGKKSCHIMQFTQASANVQPPQNIGMNISMVELNPEIAEFNSMWLEDTTMEKNCTFLVGALLKERRGMRCTIFWGDGTSEDIESKDEPLIVVHTYEEPELTVHKIRAFVAPVNYFPSVKRNQSYEGRWLYFKLFDKLASTNFTTAEDGCLLRGGEHTGAALTTGDVKFDADKGRIYMSYNGVRVYLDKYNYSDGKFYIHEMTKFRCYIPEPLQITDYRICTSAWDGEIESAGDYIG